MKQVIHVGMMFAVLRQIGNNQWRDSRYEICNGGPSPSQLKEQHGF